METLRKPSILSQKKIKIHQKTLQFSPRPGNCKIAFDYF
jgi:hypothetical protein